MVEIIKKKKQRNLGSGAPEYMVTYGDLMSLLLTFFIMLISAAKIEGQEIKLILANFPGLGHLLGGKSFNEGKLPFSGQIKNALPSLKKGRAFDRLSKEAVNVFQTETEQRLVKVVLNERGLVITVMSDFYFEKYSADFNLEKGIGTIRKLSTLLRGFLDINPSVPFKIEGYTDEINFPAGNFYEDEWGLSSARAITILRLLEQFMVPSKNAQVSGFGNNKAIVESDGGGSPFNRRVDIIILNEGNL